MTMASSPREAGSPAIEVERQLLRSLCSGQISREQLIAAIEPLADYMWRVPEHATVFQAIRQAMRLERASWRELLPAQATRMGFPDVDWSQYFTTDAEAPPLNDLVKRLIH